MFINKYLLKHATRLACVLALSCGLSTNANAIVSYTFDTLTNSMIDSRVGTFFSLGDEEFNITNNTGLTWTDFHMTLVGYGDFGSYDFMRFDDLGLDGTIYTGPGTASFYDANSDALGLNDGMNIDGLNILDGQTLSFQVDIFGGAFPEGVTSFAIYANPTVDSGPNPNVPEPSIAALLAIGLAGIGFVRRKK